MVQWFFGSNPPIAAWGIEKQKNEQEQTGGKR